MKASHLLYIPILTLMPGSSSLAVVYHAAPRYELSADDRAALEMSACMEPHGLRIDRAAAYDHGGETWAVARCESHGVVDGQPMRYKVTCVREDGSWNCWNTVEYLQAKLGSKELFLVAPRERMGDALGATKYLLRIGKFDLALSGISDETTVKSRTVYHVHVEPAGERAVRIQKHPQWLYVERLPTGDGYREAPAAEAALLEAQIMEEVAARRPIYEYFWGHHTGNPDSFRKVFLPTAHIEGNRDGKFVSWTLDEYCSRFNGKPADDERRRVRTIDHTDVSGDSAMVKATLDHGDTVFTDYFVLLKVNGEWKIANKVYNARKK